MPHHDNKLSRDLFDAIAAPSTLRIFASGKKWMQFINMSGRAHIDFPILSCEKITTDEPDYQQTFTSTNELGTATYKAGTAYVLIKHGPCQPYWERNGAAAEQEINALKEQNRELLEDNSELQRQNEVLVRRVAALEALNAGWEVIVGLHREITQQLRDLLHQ